MLEARRPPTPPAEMITLETIARLEWETMLLEDLKSGVIDGKLRENTS
jgi:hypothetical protein